MCQTPIIVVHIIWGVGNTKLRKFDFVYLVYGKCWSVDVSQPSDVVPRLLAVLVLHVGGEVAQN